METDFSRILYDRYAGLSNKRIELVLKNGRRVQGLIAGFFKGDEESEEPYIIRWHIAEEKEKRSPGDYNLGYTEGEMIAQKEIAEVRFFEDNSVLQFKTK